MICTGPGAPCSKAALRPNSNWHQPQGSTLRVIPFHPSYPVPNFHTNVWPEEISSLVVIEELISLGGVKRGPSLFSTPLPYSGSDTPGPSYRKLDVEGTAPKVGGGQEGRRDGWPPGLASIVCPRSHLWEDLQPHEDCDWLGIFWNPEDRIPFVDSSSQPGLSPGARAAVPSPSMTGPCAGLPVSRLCRGLQRWAAKVLPLREVPKQASKYM